VPGEQFDHQPLTRGGLLNVRSEITTSRSLPIVSPASSRIGNPRILEMNTEEVDPFTR
jgi:hypothetical protein